MKNIIFAILSLLLCASLPARENRNRPVQVSGQYLYHGSPALTIDEAKLKAVEQAKIQLIADRFGTVVGVSNTSVTSVRNDRTSTNFLSIGGTDVRGEWLSTNGEPKIDAHFDQNQNMWFISVQISGIIREITAVRPFVNARILRNSLDPMAESDIFYGGDYLFINFRSPVGGSLLIYLYDTEGVSRLLPYKGSADGSFHVEGATDYTLFNVSQSPVNIAGMYTLTCGAETEINRIYMIFSQKEIVHPNDNLNMGSNMPASLSFEDFQKWMTKARRYDEDMVIVTKDIIIRNRID